MMVPHDRYTQERASGSKNFRSTPPAKRLLQHNRHLSDMALELGDVRYWMNSGRHMLAASFSGLDPGRAKTFFLPQKLHATGAIHVDATVSAYFCCIEFGVNPGTKSADAGRPERRTARTAICAPHARIAARSGLIPRMFITRVGQGARAAAHFGGAAGVIVAAAAIVFRTAARLGKQVR